MRQRFRIQISDLEPIQSGVEQEITTEEAEKIVGGTIASSIIIEDTTGAIVITDSTRHPKNPPYCPAPNWAEA